MLLGTPAPTAMPQRTSSSHRRLNIPSLFLYLIPFFALRGPALASSTINPATMPPNSAIQGDPTPCVRDARWESPDCVAVATSPYEPPSVPISATAEPAKGSSARPASFVAMTSTSAPVSRQGSATTPQRAKESSNLRRFNNPILLLCICAVGSMLYNVGLWKDDDEGKESKRRS